MSRRPFGTAQKEVLLKLTAPGRKEASWSLKDGTPLYESRALTSTLCQGLVRHGYLDELSDDGHIVYVVNKDGLRKARQLRLHGGRQL